MSQPIASGAVMRDVMSLPIASIGELPADQYVGLIDDSAVACLSARLEAEGLLTPIWLRRNGNAAKVPWSVVAGRHRLRAAVRLGWTVIDAEQRAAASSGPDDLRRLQVAENLDRRTLRPIELACHVMERWHAAAITIVPAVAHNQQSAAIRERWGVLATLANTPAGDRAAIDEATAVACGNLKPRSVRRYRHLYETIVVRLPDLFAALNAHPLGESLSVINRLASLNERARRTAATALLSRDDWVSIDQVLVEADLAASKGARASASALSHWRKLGVDDRHEFAIEIADTIPDFTAVTMIARFKARGLL